MKKYKCTISADIPDLGVTLTVRGYGNTEEWAQRDAEKRWRRAVNDLILKDVYYNVGADEASTTTEEEDTDQSTD